MRALALALFMMFSFAEMSEAACTGSSPNWTSTADRASAAACVNSASSGDTIKVTGSGSVTWSPAINSTKGLSLIGPGKSVLSVTGGVSYSPTVAEASETFEVAGFTFLGNTGFTANNPNSSTAITGLKVHDNAYNNASVRAIVLMGMEFGVFYNNTFSGNYISVSVIGSGDQGWNYNHAFGSANYPYFEDNTFGNGTGAFIYETGQGGRIAFRHNTISGYACSGCEVFDLHGNQGDRGTVSSETYHNTVGLGSGTYRWMHHRGGQAIIANNVVSSNVSFNFTEYRSWGGNGTCEPYAALDQINHSFYFHNTEAGSAANPSFTNGGNPGICGGGGEASYLVLNREYWLPTSGLASARPATCTANGNTYYGATDTDVIYKCTATNTWTPSYTPYTYPHPLRQGGSPSNTPPSAPTNLRIR
jgi:hypothetical protein